MAHRPPKRAGPGRTVLIIEIDPASALPPYEQIRAQIDLAVATGVLPAGTRLPAIRQLAGDLGLAVNTVARAYRELENAGIVTSRVRHGTVVAQRRPSVPREEALVRLTEAARTFARTAQHLGIDAAEAASVVRAELEGLG